MAPNYYFRSDGFDHCLFNIQVDAIYAKRILNNCQVYIDAIVYAYYGMDINVFLVKRVWFY